MLKAPVKNLYEVVIVLKGNLSDEDLDKSISQTVSAIKNYGGNVVKVEEPVQRRFTHKVKGVKDGLYVSILFNSPPEVPNMLKRTLSIADDILRYMLIRREN
ncbi:MAG: 30S ribosomal protein S6 [Candidatus Melainabacteria bacterium]|nr:30S ribosomal protein S6 [Candidatus Melainabacteria bacterium]